MESRTYYDILGVSRDASLDEIITAKNALAKVYHPDANMRNGIDTTAYMQDILEAYKILSTPEKRKKYDHTLTGQPTRIFRTFTVGNEPEEGTSPTSFVTFWNSASKLNELVRQSHVLIEEHTKKMTLISRILNFLFKKEPISEEINEQLSHLSMQAIQHISILKAAEIPMSCWHMEAMNWVLVRWGQKQNMDYQVLFAKYDAFVENRKSNSEKMKLHAQKKQFHTRLKKLLNYAIER